jgi:outer membrane protein assembly factor BamB
MLTVVLVLGLAIVVPALVRASAPSSFNQSGNLLITDQYNNRVIEIDPTTKSIVWSFGTGNSQNCNPGPGAIIGSNDAERLANDLTLMAGTGIPPGVPNTKACTDNRVIVVDKSGNIVWQYGQAGVTGSGPNQLNIPVFAIQLPNQDYLIVDQGNNRVIEVNNAKNIVWSYGPNSTSPLNNPNSAELLANGNILIGDENNNRTIEVNRAEQVVWEYDQGLAFAAFASRLPNGNTLITDSGHARIIEVTPGKQIVWQYYTNTQPESNSNPLPTNAVRLANGNTVISDQNNNRVIIVDQSGKIVYQYGITNTPGVGSNQLYGPYTAYMIGDYNGQTPPPGLPVPEFSPSIALAISLLFGAILIAKRRRQHT